ncbi:acyl-CoA dehydrogenase family protein [Cupriavidus numazuensis]|uniref:L-prolyl-[peptidyl-carrier protein] dehydrogenase n=1 Tax=Cupriavidus numazuensis TaxID=221992 RepID=A0ABN7Q104_9BURK|nr:acyl-CoA dehydrogenase [Cupriavidus numazuensis]CAG2152379.1 L-prolyl-[peptidyl-carrier protein] dehydrogenase [Cupriavidus numazuensis]
MSDSHDDRRMLQESVRRYVERDYGFEQRRAARAEPGGFSRRHWQAFAGFGWLALGLPEACGGFGDAADQAVLAEALGSAQPAEPWLANAALCGPLLAASGDAAHAATAAAMAEGRTMLALAAWEPQGRYDAFDVATSAEPRHGGGASDWILDGRKTLVLAGGSADMVLVLARTSGQRRDRDGLTLFAVPAGTRGIAIEALPTYDGRQTATVTLRRVSVPDSARVGAVGGAWPGVEAAIDRATTMACAEAVGTMARAFELTRDYLVTREQFGRPLSANQVIRHRLVDLYVSVEQARAITEAAAAALHDDASARMRAVSLAKAFVSVAGRALGEDAVQLYGAVGMTDEMEVGHCYKRLAALANLFGDADWHYERLSAIDSATQALAA